MEAMLWSAEDKGIIHCELCAHSCKIRPGASGNCQVRVNLNGRLVSLVRDIITAIQIDPVEKKPLYHFLPGTKTLSFGGAGCNFRCFFCQNHEIAHVNQKSTIPGRKLQPQSIARLAEQNRAPSIAFTYNEPTLFFEQTYEAAALAKAEGFKTILVSNGFMSPAYLQSMSRRIDAANIDLKSFSNDFYQKFCKGRLEPVLDNLKRIRDMDWWLEVTTLVIPGVNDSPEELQQIAEFIRDELGEETPWHISAFHGAASMATHPSTPVAKLEEAWHIGADAGLKHVYIGNAQTMLGANTVCPNCGKVLIERKGYSVRRRFKSGICPDCQTPIAGVWE